MEVTDEQWEIRFAELKAKTNAQIVAWADAGWWDLDPDGNPIRKATKISIDELINNNKPLMAHLLCDLGIFKSVGEAKRNGWDKPLQLGRHELGPKKNRHIVELV